MSDNIPFEIQLEIIKKVSDVKSLIQFRSVSKPWKSFIDSSEFIKGYGVRHRQPHSRILMYRVDYSDYKYICLVDDDIETFKVQKPELAPFVVSPILKQYYVLDFVGAHHGLLCFHGFHRRYKYRMVAISNPSIGKSFGIVVPNPNPWLGIRYAYGFGVCPVTNDPTIVKFVYSDNMPWHAEVFTSSSGAWSVIPSSKLPRQSIRCFESTQVVVDRFIYWGAREKTNTDDGESTTNHMLVSFDLITKEFNVVDLPDGLTNQIYGPVSVSKLRGSLVVYGPIDVMGAVGCGVWVMEHDSSFRMLFATRIPFDSILGFKKNGEIIFETQKEGEMFTTLDVYDPSSQQIKNLGISGVGDSFFMSSYKESLLLLDHPGLHIFSNNN